MAADEAMLVVNDEVPVVDDDGDGGGGGGGVTDGLPFTPGKSSICLLDLTLRPKAGNGRSNRVGAKIKTKSCKNSPRAIMGEKEMG